MAGAGEGPVGLEAHHSRTGGGHLTDCHGLTHSEVDPMPRVAPGRPHSGSPCEPPVTGGPSMQACPPLDSGDHPGHGAGDSSSPRPQPVPATARAQQARTGRARMTSPGHRLRRVGGQPFFDHLVERFYTKVADDETLLTAVSGAGRPRARPGSALAVPGPVLGRTDDLLRAPRSPTATDAPRTVLPSATPRGTTG